MTFSAITLSLEDDIVSVCDRLDWTPDSRMAFVLPADADDLLGELDLVLLRRRAEALRVQVGVVSGDVSVRRRARAAGLPAFRSLQSAERRRAWSAPSQRPIPSRPVAPEDRDAGKRRIRPAPLWRQWLRRYAGVLLFCVVTASLLVGLAYTIPSAEITVRPLTEPLLVTRQVVADPQLDSVNFTGASVPARRLIVTEEWQASVETTGALEAPDAPARGQVVFVNTLPEPVAVPAGTRVSTSSGQTVVFQVIEAVDVPGVVGATAEADIIAVVPGPDGNVAANAINRVEGPLGIQLQVRNLDALEGGATRLARAVTEADQSRLRAQVIQQLQALALTEMQTALGASEFLAQDSLRVLRIEHETFSHFVDEQADRLTLEIRADLVATAVDETQATGLVYETLVQAIGPGYELVPDSLSFVSGDVLGVDNQGRVSFEMLGRAMVAAELNLDGPLGQALGQDVEEATAYLYQQLPVRSAPVIEVFPPWFGRVPYARSRIRVSVRANS